MAFRIDDILAAVILSLAMLRRLESLGVQQSDNPSVPSAEFQRWRRMAVGGYNLAAISALLKIIASQLWLYFMLSRPLWLSVGGLCIFLGWVAGTVIAWRQTTEARAIRTELGIAPRGQSPKR